VGDAGDIVVEDVDGGIDTVRTALTWTLGANVENLELVGAGAVTGSGNGLANLILGNGAANRLRGLAGADTLIGGEGDDTLDGGSGTDRLEGGAGNDVYAVDHVGDVVVELAGGGVDLVGSFIDWTLGDWVENLTLLGVNPTIGAGNALGNRIIGNAAANLIAGLDGADTLEGGAGADTLDGGAEVDRLIGGLGDDLYIVTAGDIIVEAIGGGVDTVRAATTWSLRPTLENLLLTGAEAINGSGNLLDNLMQGNDGANRLFGSAGADTLQGGAGDDTLNGGAGSDLMQGGGGNDTYLVENVGDLVQEAADGGTDIVVSTITWTLGDHVEWLLLDGTAAIDGTGNALDNRIIGNRGANLLAGGDGADTLDGGVGADTMLGGMGSDTYLVNSTADLVIEDANGGIDVVRSSVSFTLSAHVENLLLMGNAPLNGTGNALSNAISGTAQGNLLAGLDGNDVLNGFDGADTLLGGEGLDRLLGGTGADLLVGGIGNDTLIGGAGTDLFRFDGTADGGDRITDFAPGEDLIALFATGFGLALSPGALDAGHFALDAPDAAQAQFVYVAATGVLAFDADGTGLSEAVIIATLETKPLLTAADIVLIA
jgi:Ca2+-binding RTX toxin-like protein